METGQIVREGIASDLGQGRERPPGLLGRPHVLMACTGSEDTKSGVFMGPELPPAPLSHESLQAELAMEMGGKGRSA